MSRRNGRSLVDRGASHNFVKWEVADIIRLKKNNCGINIKAINSLAKEVVGISSRVSIQLGRWTGKEYFTMMPLDDFEVILGQDFLHRHQAVLLSFADKMVIF